MISEQLKEIADTISKSSDKINKIMLDVEILRGDHERLKKDIYGNGKKGALERIEKLEQIEREDEVARAKVLRIDEELKEMKQENKQIQKKIAYFSGIGAVIMWILNKASEAIK